MTNIILYINRTLTLIHLPLGARPRYTIGEVSQLTGVHPEMLRYYCRLGLLAPQRASDQGELTFDETALQELRCIEHYRQNLGVNRRALPLVCELRRECEQIHIELEFLRVPIL
jgi:DNA-binding transcriptional MerR regulator